MHLDSAVDVSETWGLISPCFQPGWVVSWAKDGLIPCLIWHRNLESNPYLFLTIEPGALFSIPPIFHLNHPDDNPSKKVDKLLIAIINSI